MAYTAIDEGNSLQTPSGNVRVTVNASRSLTGTQRLVLRRECDQIPDRTPLLIEAESGSGRTRLFISTGVSLFGPGLADFEFNNAYYVVFTPLIMDGSTIISEGYTFYIFLERALGAVDTDLPSKTGLFRLWDVRYDLDLNAGTWIDRVVSHQLTVATDNNAASSIELVNSSASRFQVDALLCNDSAVERASLPGGFLFNSGLPMPSQWTILFTGYPNRDYANLSLDDTKIYDAQFSYSGSDVTGPYEGVYWYFDQGLVGTSGRTTVNDNGINQQKCWAVCSDTNAPWTRVYVDGVQQGSDVLVNTLPYGDLNALFPSSDLSDNEYYFGQIAIYNRVLTTQEIEDHYAYARDVWYKPEV